MPPGPSTFCGSSLARMSALRRCIAIAPRHFAEQYWGRRPLLTTRSTLPARFDDLLDAAAVDELVSRRGLRTPFLRMANDGDVVPPARYTRGGGAGATVADQAADDRVLAQMDAGATLVLQGLHRTWPPLVGFGTELAAELGHPVQVNAYVTPAQNRGFAPHYDVHDVFVLQVAGGKRWRVHEPVLTDPLGDQQWQQRRDAVAARAAEAPILDEMLEPGDALYLPRGYVHSAVARGELSIHLTVGIHPVTRYQVVRHLLAAAAEDAELRATLPMGVDLADPGQLEPHLRDTLATLRRFLDRADADTLANLLSGDLARQTRPAPLAPLAQLAAVAALDESTVLRLRPALRCTVTRDDSGLRLRLLDNTVPLPPSAEPAVKAILAGEPFTPAELPALDAAEQVALARLLLREAVVVPARP
jgi:bifunctional lysine-specific demethylase and histidyl-hydroxylase NO66